MAFHLGGFQPIRYIDAATGRPFFVAGKYAFQPYGFYNSQQHMYPGSYIGQDGRLVIDPNVYRIVQQGMKFNSAVFELHQKIHGGVSKHPSTSISSDSHQSRVVASSGSHSTTEMPGRKITKFEEYEECAFK